MALRCLTIFLFLLSVGWAQSADVHLGNANRLMERHLYEPAAAEFEHALAIEPNLKLARYQYAICLFGAGRNDESRREFERLRKEVGPAREIGYYLGRLALLSGDAPTAVKELRSVVDDSKLEDAPYYLGLAYSSTGDEKESLKWLELAEKKTPRDYHVHYRLARLYLNAGNKEDADREAKLYQECQSAERERAARMRACNTALDQHQGDAIRQECATLYDPNDPEKLVFLGQLYGDHGAFAEAVAPLQKATQLDPASFEAWHNLGLSYFRLQRYQDARGPLEKAVQLRPDFFDSLNLLGAALYMTGDDKAALPVLERAHVLRPDDAQINAVIRGLRQK
jgi:tetratricopeptide (TPR) repeat protein